MKLIHLKENDRRTLCGYDLEYANVEVVELPEEATCHRCLAFTTERTQDLSQASPDSQPPQSEDWLDEIILDIINNEQMDGYHPNLGEEYLQDYPHALDKYKQAIIEGFRERLLDEVIGVDYPAHIHNIASYQKSLRVKVNQLLNELKGGNKNE